MSEVRLETVADLRRQGAEEFRARAVRHFEHIAARLDEAAARPAIHDLGEAYKERAEINRNVAEVIAALPLEPEGEKP